MKADQVPTREYVPLLATGPKLAYGVDLGIRASAADLGHTIVEALQGANFLWVRAFSTHSAQGELKTGHSSLVNHHSWDRERIVDQWRSHVE